VLFVFEHWKETLSVTVKTISVMQTARTDYVPRMPPTLGKLADLRLAELPTTAAGGAPLLGTEGSSHLRELFPLTWQQRPIQFVGATHTSTQALPLRSHKVGVVFSGGPAPGGHNVVWGLCAALLDLAKDSELWGFCGGIGGLLSDQAKRLDLEALKDFRNAGGFDLLGTGRAKLETAEQFAACGRVLEQRGLDALVIIGGDDSNTNAAFLAEYLLGTQSKIRVLGVPKTIDGDIKNAFIEATFGFDTAAKVYADLVANIARDAISTRKYYHFIRLMGRSASHLTLEAGLLTQPNFIIIGEDVAARRQTLRELVEELGEMVKSRAKSGRNYGVVLVPEGLIEFIPEMRTLLGQTNAILADHRDYIASLSGFTAQSEFLHGKLSRDCSHTFASLPIDIQRQMLMDRDPHGNVVVSRIETEKLLIELLAAHLNEEKSCGRYSGTFGSHHHFFGYEGRCALPSNFDADYAYSLGRVAGLLVAAGVTGYMAVLSGLSRAADEQQALGVPLTAMMNLELRHGRVTPVISRALVDLSGAAWNYLVAHRQAWASGDHYQMVGPIQYFGPSLAVCH